MKVLSINTYAGSLLLGARALGRRRPIEIIGSYEDGGFGSPLQHANFPELEFRDYRKDWPERIDLTETVVLAHPPCSAFSQQTAGGAGSKDRAGVHGENARAFACTREVLQYSMENGALALAVESVPGALAGAFHVHQRFADDYGYNLYRVLQNAAAFGRPQWRERFWAVFVRKGAAPDVFPIGLTPDFRTIGETIEDIYDDGPAPYRNDHYLGLLKKKLADPFTVKRTPGAQTFFEKFAAKFASPDAIRCTDAELEFIFGYDEAKPHHRGGVAKVLQKLKFPSHDPHEVCKALVEPFASNQMVFIHPESVTGVLLGSSWWYYRGRNISENAYKAIMGFPLDYKFPEGHYRNNVRTYLSKGVCPPVAEWVLESVVRHLHGEGPSTHHPDHVIECQPSGIADFRLTRDVLKDRTAARFRGVEEAE